MSAAAAHVGLVWASIVHLCSMLANLQWR